jgi:IS5 family transposase
MARHSEAFAEVGMRDSVLRDRIGMESMSERRIGQLSFADGVVAAASGGNEVLQQVSALVDWRPIEALLAQMRGGRMGAPGYPALLMLKALLLQRWYALSDPAMEEALKDRLSFRRFVGLPLSEDIPDHSTIWRFREALGAKLSEDIFDEIGRQIEASGFVMKQGTLIDASLIRAAFNAPRPPEGPQEQEADGRPMSKLVRSEHDPDAAWTKKEGKYYFGYKLHAAMDKHSRIIRRIGFTPCNINESTMADRLICGDEKIVYADKAYDSKQRRDALKRLGIANGIMRRGHPRQPLTCAELKRNRRLSKYRGAIEPLFHLFKNLHGFARARYRGLARNGCAATLAAIAINLKRWATCTAKAT